MGQVNAGKSIDCGGSCYRIATMSKPNKFRDVSLVALCVNSFPSVKQNLPFHLCDLFEESQTIFIRVRLFIYISHIN